MYGGIPSSVLGGNYGAHCTESTHERGRPKRQRLKWFPGFFRHFMLWAGTCFGGHFLLHQDMFFFTKGLPSSYPSFLSQRSEIKIGEIGSRVSEYNKCRTSLQRYSFEIPVSTSSDKRLHPKARLNVSFEWSARRGSKTDNPHN